jgi:hypothetical protein
VNEIISEIKPFNGNVPLGPLKIATVPDVDAGVAGIALPIDVPFAKIVPEEKTAEYIFKLEDTSVDVEVITLAPLVHASKLSEGFNLR